MPANSSRRLDEAMSSEIEGLRYLFGFDDMFMLFSVFTFHGQGKVCYAILLP